MTGLLDLVAGSVVRICVPGSLFFEGDALVVVVGNGGADLGWRLAEFSLPIGDEALFGAGGALGAVESFKATAEAGVAKGAITTAVAGLLVEDAGDLGGLFVDVFLPGVAKVFSGQLGTREDRRQGSDFKGRGGVVGRDFVGGV